MIEAAASELLGFPSITIRSDAYELTVVPAIGGRVMAFGADGVNLLYQNEGLAGYRPEYAADSAEQMMKLRQEGPQLLYGGEKTWLAPQRDWGGCHYADLDHGEYGVMLEQYPNMVKLTLTSPVCRETQLQIVRTITCWADHPFVDIEQTLIHHGAMPVTKGLWQVTMLNRPGTVVIPDGPAIGGNEPIPMLKPEHAQPNREANGWRLDIDHFLQYKVGFMTDAGRTSAKFTADNGKAYTLIKTYRVEPHQPYPHGTVAEVYNSDTLPYYELEVHGPAFTVRQGEQASFTVRWELQVSAVEV